MVCIAHLRGAGAPARNLQAPPQQRAADADNRPSHLRKVTCRNEKSPTTRRSKTTRARAFSASRPAPLYCMAAQKTEMLSAAADRAGRDDHLLDCAGWRRVEAGHFAHRRSVRPTWTKVGLEAAGPVEVKRAEATGTLSVGVTVAATFQQTFAAGRLEPTIVAVGHCAP